MTRVTSDRVRQFVLVKDEPIDPFNPLEHVQLLNEDGTIVDPSKDQTKMTWRGDWDPAATYIWNDVVTHDNSMWIAPQGLPDGAEPGVGAADPDITTVRGVMFKASDRLDSETPKTIVIGPDAAAGEQHRDNDIEGGYGAVFLIDKTGLTPTLTVTITPLSATGSVSFTLATYLAGNYYKVGLSTSWTNAEVAANTPKTIAFDDGGATDDLYCHVFFQGGVDGSFSVSVNDNTNLNGPPPGIDDPEWELITVGSEGPAGAAGAAGADGSKWYDDAGAPSGALGVIGDFYLNLTNGDVYEKTGAATWTLDGNIKGPAGADGAAGAAGAAGVGVPVGGATGYVLKKNSATDYDTGWAPESGGGSSTPDYIYLDERFVSDVSGSYQRDSGTDTLTYGTTTDGDGDVRGYIYCPNLSAGSFWRRDGYNSEFRDVLVAIEVEWQNNTGGTPVFSIDFRKQSDRFIRIQCHGTNIHIYTNVSGVDTLRANLATTYAAQKRGWIVGTVYQDYVAGWWSNQHPLQKMLVNQSPSGSNSVTFDLSSDSNFNTEARRRGRADYFRISTGSGGSASTMRILRHLIVDLDKLPVI